MAGGRCHCHQSPGTLPPSFPIPAPFLRDQEQGCKGMNMDTSALDQEERLRRMGVSVMDGIMAPTCPCPDLRPREYVTSCGKRDSADVTAARILRQGDYPGLSAWALNAITRILLWNREAEGAGQGETGGPVWRDAALLALEGERGHEPRSERAARSWNRPRTDPP